MSVDIVTISKKLNELGYQRLAAERELSGWNNSLVLADMQRDQILSAPLERRRLGKRLSEIDAAIKAAEAERARLNAEHLRAAVKPPAEKKPGVELRHATKVFEQLENRKATLSSMVAEIEKQRAAVLLPANTGDAKAQKESARLLGELNKLATEARDVAAALVMAKDSVVAAQAKADAEAKEDRAAQAAMLAAKAVELAAEFDRHAAAQVAILQECEALRRKVGALGQLSDLAGKRLANPRIIEQALLGLKPYVPMFGPAISVPRRALADSFRALWPFAGRDVGGPEAA